MSIEKEKARTRKAFKEAGVEEIFDAVEKDGRLAVSIVVSEFEGNLYVPGGSRIGGQPDLPPDVEWPRSDNHSMAFVAQINLGELADACPDFDVLPKKGVLYFFRNDYEDVANFGLDPIDFIHNKVIYYTGDTSTFEPHRFPEDLCEYERYKPAICTFEQFYSVPLSSCSPWGGAIDDFDFDDDEDEDEDDFDKLYDLVPDNDAQIFGHPEYVQGSVEEEVACAVSGADDPDVELSDNLRQELSPPFGRKETDWRLLLSVDSIDICNMMWGDMGMLYFMITKDDLEQHRFDRITCVFQCG